MDVYPYVAGSTVLREDLVDGVSTYSLPGTRRSDVTAGLAATRPPP